MTEALQEKRRALAAELEELRRDKADRAALEAERERVRRELEETLLLLEACAPSGPTRLDQLRVASPCTVPWDDMRGDDRVRFCGQCEKNVYDLSAMTRAEAEQFLADHGVSACVRLFRRTDGTILTSDCPVGVKKKRFHLAVFSVTGGALLAAGAAFGLTRSSPQPCKSYVVREHFVPPPPSATVDPNAGHHLAGGIGPRPVDREVVGRR